ncbi:tetratricopeptide repeat protein [Williamwhitmania taraxaci]|uniref:Tetratricopeptide repeat-containing protein n=1 Tax=Williamwhitmania taraxaci TaxID=1640674 RepID=A0A1G6KKU9_9BACT|nr:hypothetical protein [Williamwhitmania taraxaci]SDC31584.1 hypothetical protein SAMN05216323_102541 [Williamwhitmania taraxaci]
MRIFFVCLLFLIAGKTFGQDTTATHSDIEFAEYLVGNGMYDDALQLFRQTNRTDTSNVDQWNYLRGWAFYNLKMLDSSSIFLLKVSPRSDKYYKSLFFGAYNLTYQKRFSESKSVLYQIPDSDTSLAELKRIQLAGINLLEHQWREFETNSSHFTFTNYCFSENETELKGLGADCRSFKRKSPLVAGLLSAAVPGLGKIYAKKTGGGISAFLTVSILGALTYENFTKRGIEHPGTIVAGSLFSLAYVGNIYGSVYSVNAYREEFYEKVNYRVLFHLHIPLRNFFDR